jgi:hypothetical protein
MRPPAVLPCASLAVVLALGACVDPSHVVRDRSDGAPLAGAACVLIAPDGGETLLDRTGADGTCRLSPPDGPGWLLVVRHDGHASAVLPARAVPAVIELDPLWLARFRQAGSPAPTVVPAPCPGCPRTRAQ